MNSEELELSLRSEFESHLKTVVAEMRQEFTELQTKVEAEFDKHKSQLDAVFQEFSGRLENSTELEAGFSETVIEHLRLARDEGARISATAFAAAEEMEAETAAAAPPKAGVAELSAAISDITAQDSQATILKSLVQNAAQFTPRGAFFIIKNEHFVGWRVFGKEGEADEETVREVFFPVASATLLGESVRSLSAAKGSYGTHADDSIYLNKLEFGQPEQMYAIPLVARGRGVAVLYADYGTRGEEVNVEALATLVRVAGLTVELLAAALPAAKPVQNFQTTPAVSPAPSVPESPVEYHESTENYSSVATEQPESVTESVAYSDYSEQPTGESEQNLTPAEPETVAEEKSWASPATEEITEDLPQFQAVPVNDDNDFSVNQSREYQPAEPVAAADEAKIESQPTATFETSTFDTIERFPAQESYSNGIAETSSVETSPVETFEPVVSEPAAVAAPPVRSRFSDRNVDLPIEVGEDERRLHNDARRFARLLVSEIKLYNEQKVKEGREAQDLYERLREAIDRSRDMYDKRVQPPVAAKFDYFHYELVSSLAEGEENRLGGGYPGSVI